MNVELVAIGDEVVQGFCINGNGAYIAKALVEEGFTVVRHTVVADEAKQLKKVLHEALTRSSCVITTGGLGPTCDDHTRAVIAALVNKKRVLRKNLLSLLEKRYGKRFVTLRDQATQIAGARCFENNVGTAFGFAVRYRSSWLIALPGVPQEAQEMLVHHVLPFLKKKSSGNVLIIREYHFVGLGEHQVDPCLLTIQKRFPQLMCGIYPHYGTISVRIKADKKAQQELERAETILLDQFGAYRFFSESGTVDGAVHELMIEKKLLLATAESCTGGAIAARLVQHAGASAYLKGGIIAYNNSVKEDLLRVSSAVLHKYGAVSEQTTEQMARNVKKLLGTDCAIAISGIFGPEGGGSKKPVGTVCATVIVREQCFSWTMQHRGGRLSILEKTVQMVLAQFLRLL